MVGFIFGGNTGETYTSLQRRRAMADALAAQVMGQQPKNTAEGIGAVLKGIGAGIGRYRADKAEDKGRTAADTLFQSIIGGGASSNPIAASAATSGVAKELAASSPAGGGDYFSAIRAAESGGNDSAKNPNSSATGRYQFIDSTWAGLMKSNPELGLTADGRKDPAQQEKAIRAFTAQNAQSLASAGLEATPGNLYAAHFLGAGGARNVLRGNPGSAVSAYVDPGVIRANPFLQGMTVGEFQQWASRKGGGGSGPVQVASLDPAAGAPSAAAAIDAVAPQGGFRGSDFNSPMLTYDENGARMERPYPAQGGNIPQPQNGGAGFDHGRWGDPINLAEMPAGASDLGQRLGAQANAFVAPQQPQQPPAGALPPLDQRQVGPTPSVASQPQQMPQQQVPMQVAQAAPQVDQRLYQLLTNPFLDDDKKAVVKMMLQQQMEAADPVRQMQLEKGRLELDALRNPQPKYDYTTLPDGTVLRTNSRGGAPEKVYESAPKPTTNQLDYEYYADREMREGRQPLGPLEWEQAQRKAGATTVNNNIGEGDEFYKELDKKNAGMFATLSDAGMSARAKMGQINRLETLFANVPQGMEGGLKKIAGDWGIAIGEGTSDIQAASSLLERMVPEQRAPGSGPMSDADIKMFRASLPRIINQPGGNQLIFGTLRGIAEYETKMGEIADAVADRTITAAEGRKQIRELQNPLADYKIPEGSTPNEGWKELSPGVRIKKVGD
ncbi:hypothetical protein ACQKKX_02415 [Neorhizobium sp. NPDC001467]|uniref:hypothetical protein n=1 Tax=Neorhizobium sp. NPDC001467 TaxID=3390595 RepID=UPI003D025A52